jgi:hypothetical protein
MPTSTHATARQIVLDVLTLRGPDPNGGPFRLVAADPRLFMGTKRLALARQFSHLVPIGTSAADAPRVAADIVPLLSAIGAG